MTETILPSQVRAARALLDWSQETLAEKSGVGISTVRDFEADRRDPAAESIAGIRDALVQAGVRFVALDGECGPGVRLEIEVPKITVRPDKVSFETDNLGFQVSWRGNGVHVFLPTMILDDLEENSRKGKGNDAYLAEFKKHEALIIQKLCRALYSGRADVEGRLTLRSRDFFPRAGE